jgi:eukaryotic-like serine/threonine-protein kinase
VTPAVLARGAELAPGYRALEHLSRGRALDVYEVWSKERACACVAKVIRPDRSSDPGPRRRLRDEGRTLLALSHPNVVRAYELIGGARPALVLELLEGETVSHLVARRQRRLPSAELAILGLQLCSAVGYIHRHGWLHLDLKPSNVIVDGGIARVIDLSVARPPGRARRGIGTQQYMSPEQARGGVLTTAVDVWGVGAVLMAAVTGAHPPRVNGRPPSLRGRRLPPDLAQAIESCLEPEPEGRPGVAELADRLEGTLQG